MNSPRLALDEAGGVSIGGEAIGRLDGFRFVPDPRAVGIHGRTLRAAALKGLESEIAARTHRAGRGRRCRHHPQRAWQAVVGRRHCRPAGGRAPRRWRPASRCWPIAHVKTDELAGAAGDLGDGAHRRAAGAAAGAARRRRSQDRHARRPARRSPRHRPSAGGEFRRLDRADAAAAGKIGPLIRALRPFGVWFGRRTVYLPKLLRPDAAALLTLLWGVWTKKDAPPAPPAPGLTSFAVDKGSDTAALQPAGFAVFGGRAIRFDMLERLEDELEKALASGSDAETLLTKLVSLLGSEQGGSAQRCWPRWAGARSRSPDAKPVWRRCQGQSRAARAKTKQPEPPPDPHSPFAGLAALRTR